MGMATAMVHRGKPIWAACGGAELSVVNMAAALALTLSGPGRVSLDRVFGIGVPPALLALVALGEVALLVLGIVSRSTPATLDQQAAAKGEEGQKGS